MSCGKKTNNNAVVLVTGLTLLLFSSTGVAVQPVCSSGTTDTDNDGWGWENNASCIVDAADTETYSSTRTQVFCHFQSSDQNGDGWGWENNRSCKINSASVGDGNPDDGTGYTVILNANGKAICQTPNADQDGDGYGWEHNTSCVVTGSTGGSTKPVCTQPNPDPDGDGFGWENNTSCIATTTTADPTNKLKYLPGDITDLILITGQSNTLGAGTNVNSTQDVLHNRVFAYTSTGWQVAELYQTWDRNSSPGNGDPNSALHTRHNNFALHFGKRLAKLDSNRVVGFILVSEPGEGISHWDPGASGMNRVLSKVNSAINALPHKYQINGILWHQGETDWLRHGTSDTDISQPAPVDYYPVKLNNLINNFRSQSWFSSEKPFICGETASATGVNTHLMALNTNSDPQTSCVEGFGLAARIDGSHFTAPSLRTLGQRYADRYFEMTGP